MPKRRWFVGQKVWVVAKARVKVGLIVSHYGDLACIEFCDLTRSWTSKKRLHERRDDAHDQWFNCRDYQPSPKEWDDKIRFSLMKLDHGQVMSDLSATDNGGRIVT